VYCITLYCSVINVFACDAIVVYYIIVLNYCVCYCIMLYYSIMHCIVFKWIEVYCIVLHYVIL